MKLMKTYRSHNYFSITKYFFNQSSITSFFFFKKEKKPENRWYNSLASFR